jgi:hypothetical protein
MREPVAEKNTIDVNWGAVVLLAPFVLLWHPEQWGWLFGLFGVLLLIGNVGAALIDGRRRRNLKARSSRGPVSCAAPHEEAAPMLPAPPPAWLVRRR